MFDPVMGSRLKGVVKCCLGSWTFSCFSWLWWLSVSSPSTFAPMWRPLLRSVQSILWLLFATWISMILLWSLFLCGSSVLSQAHLQGSLWSPIYTLSQLLHGIWYAIPSSLSYLWSPLITGATFAIFPIDGIKLDRREALIERTT